MWRYVFLQLRRQPGKSVLASSGFLLAACALILLSATTQTTLVRGNQIISQNWQPIRLFLIQALILAIGGGLVGLGLALLTARFLEATPLWLVVIWTLPVMLAFAFISTPYPLWQIWHIRPVELLRAGSTVSSGQARLLGSRIGGLLMPIGTLVIRNLGRSRTRTLIAALSLFLSALLLMVMLNGVLALHQALQGTLLGDYVLLQTAVPQIAGCVIAIVLTFLSVADLLLLQVRERQKEIGLLQAVGWRPWAIQRLFVQEGLMLALSGAIPGVLVAWWIVSMQHATQDILPTPLVALGAVSLLVLVAACAAIPALRALSRLQVADILRAE
jgi:putative ABC transport system permease protein